MGTISYPRGSCTDAGPGHGRERLHNRKSRQSFGREFEECVDRRGAMGSSLGDQMDRQGRWLLAALPFVWEFGEYAPTTLATGVWQAAHRENLVSLPPR